MGLISKLLFVRIVISPDATQLMRRLNITRVDSQGVQAPDLDSLLGTLKPLGAIRTTEVKKTIEFCQTSPCQAHHNMRSLLTSPKWHLSVLLKAYIAVFVSKVLVLSQDTPSEVILDLCHVCR